MEGEMQMQTEIGDNIAEWERRRDNLMKHYDGLPQSYKEGPRGVEFTKRIDFISTQIFKLKAEKLARLNTAWTGGIAFFSSIEGDYGEIPYSELAMHTRVAGKRVSRYALFKDDKERVCWVHVEAGGGVVVDGLPSELLPFSLREKHGIR